MRRRVFTKLFLFGLVCLSAATGSGAAPIGDSEIPEYVPFSFFDRTLEEELESDSVMQPSSQLFEAVSIEEESEDEYGEAASDTASELRPRYQTPRVQPQRNVKATPPSEVETVTSAGHLINNVHSCDGASCGAGCGREAFHHLGTIKRGKGYCDACGMMTCPTKTFNRWFVDGWVTVGSTLNFDWPKDRDNVPLRYNDRNGEVVLNQLYLSFGRNVDKRRNKFDFGGRIDVLFGTDYLATSSLNLETRDSYYDFERTELNPYAAKLHWNSNKGPRRDGSAALYGLSLPQAYAEVFVPLRFGTTVKAGHFYSAMGLESAMSPQNFFYSHSYSFMYGAPTTLTGITATTQWTKRFSTVFGLTQGWDVFDNPMDRINYLGGVRWESLDRETAVSFIVHTGKESERPGNDIRTGYVLTLSQLLTKRLRYSLEHTLGYEDKAKLLDPFTGERGPGRWFSIAQYLQWELNDRWSVGLRGEWFRDDGYSRITNLQERYIAPITVSGKDIFEVTLGVNWKPTRFVTIRPELRYDWSNTRIHSESGTTGIFDSNREMFSFAIDAVVRF